MASEYEASYRALGVCVAARVPVVLWGPPGQGKTSVIRDVAAAQGRMLEVIMASIREPQDFAGLPVVHDGGMALVPPDWARRLSADGNGILFLDEVNTAPPSVQAALLRVSLDRVAGDCHLGDGTSVVAAANPPELAADGWDLAPPLANRFCHLPWQLPGDVLTAGFMGMWPRYEISVPSRKAVREKEIDQRVLVAAFLNARAELVTVLPGGAAEQGRAFPTPRSWEMVATLLSWTAAAGESAEVDRMLVRGCVGQGAAAEFLTFRDNLDLPDSETVLADPSKVKIPERADKVFVLAAGVLAALRQDVSPKRWNSAGTVLGKVADEGHPDVAVTFARQWLQLKPEGQPLPNGVLRSLVPLLTAARML